MARRAVRWPGLVYRGRADGKTVDRTAGIMSAMLTRTAGYGEDDAPGSAPRYGRLLYVVTRATVERARAVLPDAGAQRVEVRDLPPGALP